MADATDVPATEAVTTEPAAAPPVTEPEPYQPLSLLAVAALGVAGVYSAVVLFGGLFAMFNRSPWLLPLWTFGVPLLAAGAALIARYQIRRSEGTQSGLALTSWTFYLSFGVGFIIYGSYYLGTFVLVRWQAQTFAEKWLRAIADGKTEEAFFETTKPPRKIVRAPEDTDDKAAVRRMLELVYNITPDQTRPGAFTGFSRSEFVRLLQSAGPNAKIEADGVKDWDYEKGGFSVTLAYRVTTDLAVLPVQVKVQSSESGGRQWQVLIEDSGLPGQTSTFEYYTDRGKKLRLQNQMAERLANDWVRAVSSGNVSEAYADTLDAADRAQYRQYVARFALGSVLAADGSGLEHLRALRKVAAGGLVRTEEGTFWAPDAQSRERAEAEVKGLFAQVRNKTRGVSLQSGSFPSVTSDGKRFRLGYDLQIVAPGDEVPLLIEGRVIVGADLDTLAKDGASPDAWRVEALELVRGRNAPPPSGPGAPGGPMPLRPAPVPGR